MGDNNDFCLGQKTIADYRREFEELQHLRIENNQLKARVERLCQFALDVRDELPCDSGTVNALVNETPALSLAEHDAALLREWGIKLARQAYPKYEDKFGEGHYVAMTNMSRELHEEANRLLKKGN